MTAMGDAVHHLVGRRRRYPRARLLGAAPEVARDLLGALLVRDEPDGPVTVVRVVETEAYRQDDPASHSYRRRTPRVEVMYGPPGHAYVYFTYGMHWCMNVSCEPEGTGAAVLLRAAAVVRGAEHVRERRGPAHRDRDLLAGPARLTQGIAVDRSCDGLDLLAGASRLRLEVDDLVVADGAVATGPRVGVREAADVPWRFWLDGVAEVSRYTRHRRAAPPRTP